jgi:hypothetical protein
MPNRRFVPAVLLVSALPLLTAIGPAGSPVLPAEADQERDCLGCHTEGTPNIVQDWQLSRHAASGVECATCHMGDYTSVHEGEGNSLPTPRVCGQCHPDRVEQFSAGKHALAWSAMKAMPSTHMLPVELSEGMKGCGGCHKIGLKSEEEIAGLRADGHGYGVASCDACHTRHLFSAAEASQPEACQTCHMGFDHPQWEMYSSSKHGVRHGLKRDGVLPESAAAPTCQTCHMQDRDHEVRTPWGFLAVRLPLSEDPQWQADQVTILQALGVLDPEGNPTPRLDTVRDADLARLTQEDFDRERDRLLQACSQCHSPSFARGELAKGDEMIRKIDHLLAEAIREIVDLYSEGVLEKPDYYANPFPDLLYFQDASTVIEQRLFEMHLKHRMRAFQGVFHANPDYALWYGWSEMVRDLTEIVEMADEMRRNHTP